MGGQPPTQQHLAQRPPGRASTKESPINPKLQNFAPPAERRHRINREIRAYSVRVISDNGDQLGIMDPRDAFDLARERGLDLVEVAPDAKPPVCKILDYGRFKYEESKRSAPRPKSELKTITLRPKTGEHDLETKLNQARRFLYRGDKVRFEVRMKGREKSRPEMWANQLNELIQKLSDISTVTQRPQPDGKGIAAIVEPLKHIINKPAERADGTALDPADDPAAEEDDSDEGDED